MIVKGLRHIVLLIVILLGALQSAMPAFADQEVLSEQSKVIGVVKLTKAGITKSVYRRIDSIVPELKKLSPKQIIRLECRYNGAPDREQDVLKAFTLAGRVEKYLRERHKLNIDVWLTTHIGVSKNENAAMLVFSKFSDDIRKLDKQPVIPVKAQVE